MADPDDGVSDPICLNLGAVPLLAPRSQMSRFRDALLDQRHGHHPGTRSGHGGQKKRPQRDSNPVQFAFIRQKAKGRRAMARMNFGYLPHENPCAQCGKPIATPEWIENGPRRTSYLWHCWACDTTSSRRWPSSRTRLDGTPARASRWSRFINPTGGDDDRCHDKTAPADRERPDRVPRCDGRTASGSATSSG